MAHTTGCNHVALVTTDLDRFIAFYTEIFDATVMVDLDEGEVRHALLDLGSGFALHPFQFNAASAHATASPAMFDRGHLDHLGLNVTDPATFEMLRRRLVEAGASDGTLTDFGRARSVSFTDPDGMDGEVAMWTDGAPLSFDERLVEAYAPTGA